MSQMEYNKGKLIKVEESIESVAEREITTLPKWYDNKLDYFINDAHHDLNYAIIGGVLYKVEWEVKGEELNHMNNLTKDVDGNLLFETYHYNGGGHWTELVESKMRKL